jgi:hypothetical protein
MVLLYAEQSMQTQCFSPGWVKGVGGKELTAAMIHVRCVHMATIMSTVDPFWLHVDWLKCEKMVERKCYAWTLIAYILVYM